MPLFILGFVVIIGIVIYGLLMYANSGEEDTRSVRERYPFAFPPKKKKGADYTIIDDDSDAEDPSDAGSAGSNESTCSSQGGGGRTIYFPADAEREKRKRNIR